MATKILPFASSKWWTSKQRTESLRQRVIALLGSVCAECQATPIHYAHMQPTRLRGKGRGQIRRLRDILKHPKRYKPLCAKCHYEHDHPNHAQELPIPD